MTACLTKNIAEAGNGLVKHSTANMTVRLLFGVGSTAVLSGVDPCKVRSERSETIIERMAEIEVKDEGRHSDR